jgi:hypothetical protein
MNKTPSEKSQNSDDDLMPEYHFDYQKAKANRFTDRLRPTTLILNDLTQQNVAVIDTSNNWTEQDQLELTSFSLQHANSLFPDEEEIARLDQELKGLEP